MPATDASEPRLPRLPSVFGVSSCFISISTTELLLGMKKWKPRLMTKVVISEMKPLSATCR